MAINSFKLNEMKFGSNSVYDVKKEDDIIVTSDGVTKMTCP